MVAGDLVDDGATGSVRRNVWQQRYSGRCWSAERRRLIGRWERRALLSRRFRNRWRYSGYWCRNRWRCNGRRYRNRWRRRKRRGRGIWWCWLKVEIRPNGNVRVGLDPGKEAGDARKHCRPFQIAAQIRDETMDTDDGLATVCILHRQRTTLVTLAG